MSLLTKKVSKYYVNKKIVNINQTLIVVYLIWNCTGINPVRIYQIWSETNLSNLVTDKCAQFGYGDLLKFTKFVLPKKIRPLIFIHPPKKWLFTSSQRKILTL